MSRDRFNSNVDRRVKTEATPIRRVEVITGVERRRDWTDEQKLSIIAESCRDGVVISDVARRHGLRPQQLFNWRNEFRKREAARRMHGGTPAFAPVMIADERPPATKAEVAAAPLADAPMIEIVLGGATVRTRGAIDAKALAAVLRAVKAIA
ncbi:MAG: transposase [Methylocystis sp.]|jgi:transposase